MKKTTPEENSIPIYIIGAGNIINDAHLPAYVKAGFRVQGIVDKNPESARLTANRYSIPEYYNNLDDLLEIVDSPCVFDIAVPANELLSIVKKLPLGSNVLMQKPMGENLAEAKEILLECKAKNMNAGVNFQLRYAPAIVKAKEIMKSGIIGEICDLHIQVDINTPWHLWGFLLKSPRVEILYHSIHYMDLIRSFWGNPNSIFARTFKHPMAKDLDSVKCNIIMDYGKMSRASIHTNHSNIFGAYQQQALIKIEGTKGVIKINLNSLINYPNGESDTIEYAALTNSTNVEWTNVPITGNWFSEAFSGSMKEILLVAAERKDTADNHVTDCINTMACVEAAYISASENGKPINY